MELKRVQKRKAEKMYEKNVRLTIVPDKCSVHNNFCSFEIQKSYTKREFSNIISEFTYYNCNSVAGKRVHYYIQAV